MPVLRLVSLRHIGLMAVCVAVCLVASFSAGKSSPTGIVALAVLLPVAVVVAIAHIAAIWPRDDWFTAIVLNVTVGIALGPLIVFVVLVAVARLRGISLGTAPPELADEIRIVALALPVCVALVAAPVGVVARRLSLGRRMARVPTR